MTGMNDLMRRVAGEASPSAVYNRANVQDMEDYILLTELVDSRAVLPVELKRRFLAVMLAEYSDGPPISDGVVDGVEDYAAMDTVVDLDSLHASAK